MPPRRAIHTHPGGGAPIWLLLAVALSLTAHGGSPWFQRSKVGLEVGPTGSQFGGSASDTGFAVRFDGGAIARAAAKAHAEYLVLWTREGDWAFYNSRLQPKAPGLGGRDVLREGVEEGKRLGLPVIAYCQVQYPSQALREHPEWRMVGADGKPIEGRVCYRSGYLEFMKRMVEEQLAYGIDGFHLDMVDQGFGPPYGCWCDACQRQFQALHGHPMPKGPTWDEEWDEMLEFRYASSELFERELAAHVRSLNPRASLDFNYHGNPPFSWEVGQRPVQHARNGDFVTGETGVWGFSALTVGLNAEFYRAANPGHPFQIAMQRGVRMYHDQTTRPLEDLRWELFTLLAHGGFVTIVDKTGFDGGLDPVAYERFGQLFESVAARRTHFGQEPVQEVGIYYSSRTRDWVGREKPADFFQAFQGVHKAMVYEHIPWGVLLDENLSASALARFRVVVLPNTSIVTAREVELFREYVASGGNLLVLGSTGTRGPRGGRLAESPLAELVGARVVRELESQDNWVRFAAADRSEGAERLAPGGRRDWPFLVRGPAVVYQPLTATVAGELMKPHRTWLHAEGRYNRDWPLSADAPVGPAALVHPVGKGRVLTLSASPDWATASDHATVETRKLLADAVRWLDPSPRITLRAPVTVQSVVTDDPVARTLRVHLLGYSSPPQTTPSRERPYVLPPPIEEGPLFRVSISVSGGIRKVSAADPTTVVTRRGRGVEATVSGVYDVLILGY
ncbi:MAG TPA: hypothetical protein DCM86_18365 [Verrucomicrobiales bacterium]|nr:hypothetical protein [Verrucomicrobiales bacterium]